MSGLSLFVVIFLLIIISVIALLAVFYICNAVCFKARFASKRHMKFWVRPVMNGMRPGTSAERIFRPLDDEAEANNPPSTESCRTSVMDTECPKEIQSPRTSVHIGETTITVYRESDRESWDEAKVKVGHSSDQQILETVVVHSENTQPAIINSSNSNG